MKVFGRKPANERLERCQASPRWVDGQFRNVHPQIPNLRKDSGLPIREFFCPKEQRRPFSELPTHNPVDDWRTPPETGLRATVLGHSTVFIEVEGVKILTDPVWGQRASPLQNVGPIKRFQQVPVSLDELPRPDVILLSHDHYDHLDYPTIKQLAKTDIPFVTSLGIGSHLEYWGVSPERITELDWWERTELPGKPVAITATPAQHFSGRGPGMTGCTLWSSFVIESPSHRVFFGADTGLTTEYRTIYERFGAFDLAFLEVGAYDPAWGDIHLGPDNALTALSYLGAPPLIPIHWGTFDLAMHRWDQPIERLLQRSAEVDARLIIPKHGRPTEPGLSDEIDTWWREIAALHIQTNGSAEHVSDDEAWEPID